MTDDAERPTLAAQRHEELALLAQMALDHRAMSGLRAAIRLQPPGERFYIECHRGGVFVQASNICVSGPDIESALCALSAAILRYRAGPS